MLGSKIIKVHWDIPRNVMWLSDRDYNVFMSHVPSDTDKKEFSQLTYNDKDYKTNVMSCGTITIAIRE
jgi:hypothetical protein